MTGADRVYLTAVIFLVAVLGAGVYCFEQRQPAGRDDVVLSTPVDFTSSDSVIVRAEGDLPVTGLYTFSGDATLAEVRSLILGDAAGTEVEWVLRPAGQTGTGPQLIDLNNAEPWLLEALPGIGEKRAAAIVRYRDEHGGFRAPEELLFVEGIGPSTYEVVRDFVTVTPVSD